MRLAYLLSGQTLPLQPSFLAGPRPAQSAERHVQIQWQAGLFRIVIDGLRAPWLRLPRGSGLRAHSYVFFFYLGAQHARVRPTSSPLLASSRPQCAACEPHTLLEWPESQCCTSCSAWFCRQHGGRCARCQSWCLCAMCLLRHNCQDVAGASSDSSASLPQDDSAVEESNLHGFLVAQDSGEQVPTLQRKWPAVGARFHERVQLRSMVLAYCGTPDYKRQGLVAMHGMASA